MAARAAFHRADPSPMKVFSVDSQKHDVHVPSCWNMPVCGARRGQRNSRWRRPPAAARTPTRAARRRRRGGSGSESRTSTGRTRPTRGGRRRTGRERTWRAKSWLFRLGHETREEGKDTGLRGHKSGSRDVVYVEMSRGCRYTKVPARDGRRTIKKRSHMRTCATQVTRGKGENFFPKINTRGVVGGGPGGSGHGVRSLCFFRLGHETREEGKDTRAERPQKWSQRCRGCRYTKVPARDGRRTIKKHPTRLRALGRILSLKIKIFFPSCYECAACAVSLPRRSSRCSSDSCSRGETRAAPSGQPGAPR